jgi:hypothetical protein
MASTPDGPRYVAGLQDVADTSCYKDFFENEVFEKVKENADAAADKNQRTAIVYDRKLMAITHKKVIVKTVEEVVPPLPKKGKKKVAPKIERKCPKKEITKDDYF